MRVSLQPRHNGVTKQKRDELTCGCKCLKTVRLLVEQRGIEPLTSALRTRRSAKLSYCPTPNENTVSSLRIQVFEFSNPPIRQLTQMARNAKVHEHDRKHEA